MILVSDLARLAGATPKAIRYYDKLGLIRAERNASGYRSFDESAVEFVRLIRRAQLLGLRLEEIREILDLLQEGRRPCSHVRDLLQQKRREVTHRIRELKALDRFLTELGSTSVRCTSRSCPILARVDPKTARFGAALQDGATAFRAKRRPTGPSSKPRTSAAKKST